MIINKRKNKGKSQSMGLSARSQNTLYWYIYTPQSRYSAIMVSYFARMGLLCLLTNEITLKWANRGDRTCKHWVHSWFSVVLSCWRGKGKMLGMVWKEIWWSGSVVLCYHVFYACKLVEVLLFMCGMYIGFMYHFKL